MKTAYEVLRFHIDTLSVNDQKRVLAAMDFYAMEVRQEVERAWHRNREELSDAMKRLEERIKELEQSRQC